MKIGIFNTFDNKGGAARAAYRLHQGILKSGNQSTMFVQKKQSDDKSIVSPTTKSKILWSTIIPTLDSLPLIFYPERKGTFSTGWLSSFDANKCASDLDIFNFHWVAGGFQSINAIANVKKPLVLTLHDSWAFTGGCHVPFNCERFVDNCGQCPQLKSGKNKDLSYKIWNKKRDIWQKKDIVLVGDGNWVANNALRSSLFNNSRVEVVNPGLDLTIYKPQNKTFAREVLGIQTNKKVILFGAISATEDVNKGFHLLLPALQKLAATYTDKENLKIIVFGASASGNSGLEIGLDITFIGKLNDDISLSILYSAADVMIVPSIQECFGQTASESFACGTPVVAFNATGLKDIVDHTINGYLATPYDPMDLADGIAWVLADNERLKQLGLEARRKAEKKFGIETYVDGYLKIYNSLLK